MQPLNIIKHRLQRAVRLTYSGERHRTTDFAPRRTSKVAGRIVYDQHLNVLITKAMHHQIKSVCDELGMSMAPLLRDAIEFYLGMAQAEIGESKGESGWFPQPKRRRS
jgi:hypothetical protein